VSYVMVNSNPEWKKVSSRNLGHRAAGIGWRKRRFPLCLADDERAIRRLFMLEMMMVKLQFSYNKVKLWCFYFIPMFCIRRRR
jgi:hypothetical protein